VAVFSPPGVTINEFEKPDREQVLIIAGTTYRLSLLAGRGDSPRVTTWLIKDSPPPTNSENPEKSHDKQRRKPSHEWKLKEPRSVDSMTMARYAKKAAENACGRQPQNVILFTRPKDQRAKEWGKSNLGSGQADCLSISHGDVVVLAVLILTAADGTKRTHLKPPNGCSLPLRQVRGGG